jgi:HisA/HisF family protein
MKANSPVVPVLDLMIGQIVLAVGGVRDEYRPVSSKLTRSSAPVDVAKAIFYQTGCDCLYLADIDSFAGAEPNWRVYNELIDAGFGLWIDANWTCDRWRQKIQHEIKSLDRLKVILSSETMSCPEEFATLGLLKSAGITPIFSLDKKGDSIITRPGELNQTSPLELVQRAFEQGVRDLIVLDLESVGTRRGVEADDSATQPLLQEITQELPEMCLISGGGIRDAADAQCLLNAGCQHVLVASAIHDCRFTPDDVAKLRPFRRNCPV